MPVKSDPIQMYSLYKDDSGVGRSGKFTGVYPVSDSVPIYSVYNKGDGMTFSRNGKTCIDWDSFDIFMEILFTSKRFIKKGECSLYSILGYKRGFLTIYSLFNKKVVCVRGIKRCERFKKMVLIDTAEYGYMSITFGNLKHATAVEKVIKGFISGLYHNGLP